MSEHSPNQMQTAKIACLGCGSPNDGATEANTRDGRPPGDNDVALCAYCGRLAFYVGTPAIAFREPTAEELVELLAMPEVIAIRAAIKARTA